MGCKMKRALRWDELTSEQIKKLDNRLPVVIPVGCVEAHGHLPVGCDNIAATALAERACRRTGAILAPGVFYGVIAPGEKDGDIPVTLATFTDYILQVVQGIYSSGFKKIIFVNAHGGNIDALEAVCGEMYERYDGDVRMAVFNWWLNNIPAEWECIVQDGAHADRGETDLMLALKPNLIKAPPQNSAPYPKQPWYYTPGTVVDGHPWLARPVEGKKVLGLVLKNLVGVIRTAMADRS